MKRKNFKIISAFFLGMLVCAVGWFIVSTFVFVQKPEPAGIIYDWERICFWPDVDGIYAAVYPKGCYSATCTAPRLRAGTGIVDRQT